MPQTINRSVFPEVGDKVTFLDANGYEHELNTARKYFTKGESLTVKRIEIGAWSSYMEFEELPGKQFNTVMFELLEQPVAEPVKPEELVTLELTIPERNIVLAALRWWQKSPYVPTEITDIASDHLTAGCFLTDEEIDTLIEEKVNVAA